MPSFDWPRDAAPLPIEPLRAPIERLQTLAARHEGVLELIDPLETDEEEAQAGSTAGSAATAGTAGFAGGVAGDPATYLPPALSRIADEFGGISVVGGAAALTIVVDERSDLGPYTILTDPLSFTPLYEGDDVAVVLAIDESGAPGAVFAIGENLALTLVAPDLGEYIGRYADALDLALTGGEEPGSESRTGTSATGTSGTVSAPDAELVAERMEGSFFAPLFEEEGKPVVPLAASAPEGITAPTGTAAIADLRGAPLGSRVEVLEADLPGDPLAIRIAWREGGLVVCVTNS
ncbi:hypothetical protein DEO23_01530 [Brachybacterium endophyticum]|uniref:Uncharacterized protein n=1 Tax=Brachybacterium endophyticum TaxID=2182385 RepID=A0A2U2RNK2_9MICO|nr:hypothetical protein [Brachybacterium endophyticum]PWH07354.1 hypothetical protein DEO23_01530 [Brachybacterium endophyticum]